MASDASSTGLPSSTGLTAARVRAAVAAARGERTRSMVVVDVLVVLGALTGALTASSGLGAVWSLLPNWWPPVDVGVSVAASVALWWRRRHPVAVGIALAVVGGVFAASAVAALVAVYTVASMRRVWIGTTVAAVHLAIAIPYVAVVPIAGVSLPTWIVVMVLLYVTALAIGLAVRARRQVIAGLVAAADAERRDQAELLVRAREAERARIAREMHDVLAHRLSLLSVHAGALEHRTRRGTERPMPAAEIHRTAGVIRSSSHVALEELRDVLDVLGSGARDELGTGPPQPGLATLDDLVADAEGAGQRVRWTVDERDRVQGARPQLQRTVYRLVQEGLTNARKHAPGAAVDVAITLRQELLTVTVSNALPVGVTTGEVPGSGAGLEGLAERVRLDGGTLTAGVDGAAFVLRASIPWRR